MQMKGIMRGTYIFEGNVGYQLHAWDHRHLGYVISHSNGYRVTFSASGFQPAKELMGMNVIIKSERCSINTYIILWDLK